MSVATTWIEIETCKIRSGHEDVELWSGHRDKMYILYIYSQINKSFKTLLRAPQIQLPPLFCVHVLQSETGKALLFLL